jgi:hypothetical protein
MPSNFTWVLFACLIVAGCKKASSIQNQYENQRSRCQQQAEQNVGQRSAPADQTSAASRDAEMLRLFGDCMSKKGWQINVPKRKASTPSPVTASRSLPRFTSVPATPEAVPAPTPAAVPAPVPAPAAAGAAAPAVYQPVTPKQ